MNAQPPLRGGHLVKAGNSFVKDGFFTRLIGKSFAGSFQGALARIDQGLVAGSLLAHLPDGETRMLGGRGAGPAAEIHLRDWRALIRLGSSGSVGWYKAWELGEWESPDPVQIFDLFMRNRVALGSTARAGGISRIVNRLLHFMRRNNREGSRKNIEFHYDLGNDFYAAWLDQSMNYSSALYASDDDSLEDAQQRKMRAISRRLDVGNGDKVLEIGCGWGALAHHIASECGAHVTAITLSSEQAKWARKTNRNTAVDIVEVDYRDVTGTFDAIASVEMVEAVGQEYWPQFLDTIANRLRPGGRAALQYISIADDIFESYAASADFIQTYIFPGGMLLSESRFRALAEERGLRWSDQTEIGSSYAQTLRQWRLNFDLAVDEGRLPAGFDAHFVRLWRYYLMYCEGGFRGGGISVAQVTLVKPV